MTEEQEPIKPTVLQELPDECDTCGEDSSHLEPVIQERKTAFSSHELVVGYFCTHCTTGHLYQ